MSAKVLKTSTFLLPELIWSAPSFSAISVRNAPSLALLDPSRTGNHQFAPRKCRKEVHGQSLFGGSTSRKPTRILRPDLEHLSISVIEAVLEALNPVSHCHGTDSIVDIARVKHRESIQDVGARNCARDQRRTESAHGRPMRLRRFITASARRSSASSYDAASLPKSLPKPAVVAPEAGRASSHGQEGDCETLHLIIS